LADDNVTVLGMDVDDIVEKAGIAAQALEKFATNGIKSLERIVQKYDSDGKKLGALITYSVEGAGKATVQLSKDNEVLGATLKGNVIKFTDGAKAAREYALQLTKLAESNEKASKVAPKAVDYSTTKDLKSTDQGKITKDFNALNDAIRKSGASAEELKTILTSLSAGAPIAGPLTQGLTNVSTAFNRLQKNASVLTNTTGYIQDSIAHLTGPENLASAAKIKGDNFARTLIPPAKLGGASASEILRVQEAGERLTTSVRQTEVPKEQLESLFIKLGKGDFANLEPQALGIARAYLEVKNALNAIGSAAAGASAKQLNFLRESREGLDPFTQKIATKVESKLGPPTTIPLVTPKKTEDLEIGYIAQLRRVSTEAQRLNVSSHDLDKALSAALSGRSVGPLTAGLETIRFEFVKLIAQVNAFKEANAKALAESQGTKYREVTAAKKLYTDTGKQIFEGVAGAAPKPTGLTREQEIGLKAKQDTSFARLGEEALKSKASLEELTDAVRVVHTGLGAVPNDLDNIRRTTEGVVTARERVNIANQKAFDISNATATRSNISQYAINKEQVSAALPRPVLANVPPEQAAKLYSAFDTIASKAAQAALNVKASAGEIQQAFVSALSGTKLDNSSLQKFVDIIRTATDLTTKFEVAAKTAFNQEFAIPQREGKQLLGQQARLAKSTYEGVAGPPIISPDLEPADVSNFRKRYAAAQLSVATQAASFKATPAEHLEAATAAFDPTKTVAPHLENLTAAYRVLGQVLTETGRKGVEASNARKNAENSEQLNIAIGIAARAKSDALAKALPQAHTTVVQGARDTFGPLPSAATFASVQRYNEIIDKLTHSLASGSITANQYSQALKNIASKAILDPAASEPVKEASKDISNLATVTTTATGRTGLFAGAFAKLTDQTRIFTRLATYRIFSDLNNVMVEGIRAASELGQKIALIRTITQDQPASTQAWTKSVRELSDQFGQPITEVASAGYDTLSNQVAQNAEQTQKFLATISEFARTTGSSLNDSVGIFTTAIKGFGVDISESEHVASLFFNTIDYGRVTAEGLNAVLGRTGPLARDLGVSLEEVSAALTLLTLKGFNPQEAGTRVANFLLAFEKPSAEFKKFLSSYGVDDGKGFITVTGGMAGAINELAKAAESGSVTVAALFPEIRKLQAAVGLATDGGKEYAEALKNISTQQATYQSAKGITSETFAQRFKEETTRLQNVVTVDIATKLQQVFITVSDLVGGLSNKFKQLVDVVVIAGSAVGSFYIASLAIKGLVSILGGIVTAYKAVTTATLGATAANAAYAATSGGKIAAPLTVVGGTGLAVAGFAAGYFGVDAIIRKLKEDYIALLEQLDKKTKVNIDVDVDEFKSRLGIITSEINKDLKTWNTLYSRQAASVINILETQFTKHKSLLKDIENQTGNVFKLTLSSLERGIQGIESAAKKASDYSNEAKQKAKDTSLDFERNQFQTRIGAAQGDYQAAGYQGVSPNEAALTLNRIATLKQRAAAIGKEAEVNPAALERLNSTLQEAYQLANGLQNSFVQQRGSYNDIIAAGHLRLSVEQLILQSINNQAIAQAKFAESAANKAKEQRKLFEQVKDDYKKFEDLSLVNEKTGKYLEPEIVGGVTVRTRAQKGQERIDELDKLKAKILKGIDDINKITGTVNIPERIDISSTLKKQVSEFKTAIDKFEDAKKSIGKEALDITNVETGIQKLTTDIIKATQVIKDNQDQLTKLTGQYGKLSFEAGTNINRIGTAIGSSGSTVFHTEPGIVSQQEGADIKNAFRDLVAPIENLRLNPEKAPDVLKQLEDFENKSKLFSTVPIVTGKNEKGYDTTSTLGDLFKLTKISVEGIAKLVPELEKRKETVTSTQINVKELETQKKSIEQILSGSLPQALTGTAAEFNALKESLSKDAPALSRVINTLTSNIEQASNNINQIIKTNTPLSKEQEAQLIPPAKAINTSIPESAYVGSVIPYESAFRPPATPTPLVPPGFVQEESKGGLISPYFTSGGLTPDFPAEPSGMNYSESAGGLIAAYQEGGMITRQPYKGDLYKDIPGRNIHYLYEKGGVTKYYAEGGFIPKGTDTIPAMLSPNEYVMPADKTKKYRTTLESMKSGYFEEGGDTSLKDSIAITKRNLGSTGSFATDIITSMIDDATQGYTGGLVKYLAEGGQLDLSQLILKYLNNFSKNFLKPKTKVSPGFIQTIQQNIPHITTDLSKHYVPPGFVQTVKQSQIGATADISKQYVPPGFIQTVKQGVVGITPIQRPNAFNVSNLNYKPDFSLPISKGPYTSQFGTNPAPSQRILDELTQKNTDIHKINVEANTRTLLADRIAENHAKVISATTSYKPYPRLPYSRGPYTDKYGNNPAPTQKELDSYIQEQQDLTNLNINASKHVDTIQRIAASDASKVLKENPGSKYKPYFDLPIPKGPYTSEYGNNPPPKPKDLFNQLEEARERHRINIEAEKRIQGVTPKRPDIIQPVVPPYPTPVVNIPEAAFAPAPVSSLASVTPGFKSSPIIPEINPVGFYKGGYYAEGGKITDPDNIINELLLQWNAKEGSSLGSAHKASDKIMGLMIKNPEGAVNLNSKLHGINPRKELISAAEKQGYPVGQITPASFSFALQDYKGTAPEILRNQNVSTYSESSNIIKLNKEVSKVSLDKLGTLRHELEHSKQQTTVSDIDSDFLKQIYQPTAEIPASLGDIIHTTSIFQQHMGKPLDAKVTVAPGITHDASFISKQAKEHGFLEGKSTTELLATPSGQAYLTRLLKASNTSNKSMGGESTRGIIGLGNYSSGGVSFENYNESSHAHGGFENYYSEGGKNYSDIAQQCFNNPESSEQCSFNLKNSSVSIAHKYGGGLTKYYQDGGVVDQSTFISKGTDTIPAMLTPKEYVVSNKGTTKFLKELTLMNQGIDPSYHSYGGLPTYAQGLSNQLNLQKQYRSDVAGLQNLAVDPISNYKSAYSKPTNFSHNYSSGGVTFENYNMSDHVSNLSKTNSNVGFENYYQDGGNVRNNIIPEDVAISNLISHWNLLSSKGDVSESASKIESLLAANPKGAANLEHHLHGKPFGTLNLVDAAQTQGYPTGQVTPASFRNVAQAFSGSTPAIVKNQLETQYIDNKINLKSQEKLLNIDTLGSLKHQLEHVKQGNVPTEIPAVLGDYAHIAQSFKQYTGKPIYANVEVAPGVIHDANWIAQQAEKHGLFKGKSATEILATPSGQSYIKRLLDASSVDTKTFSNPFESSDSSYSSKALGYHQEGGLTDSNTVLNNIISHWNIEGAKSSIGKDKDASGEIVKLMAGNHMGAINLVNKLHTDELRKSIVDYAVSKGYPQDKITPASVNAILNTWQGKTPTIIPHQSTSNSAMIQSPFSRVGITAFDKLGITLADKNVTNIDRLGALRHEMEHTKQVIDVGNVSSPKIPNFKGLTSITASEIPASLGDIPYTAQVFKQHMKEPLNFPVKLSPNITHDADWMAKQAEKHGFFSGRSTTELLATPSGQSYLTRLLDDSATNKYMGGLVKYFQEGGKNIFVPKGTDTIPAMLSPNEFVVSTKGSLKFLPQLEMINQGIDPWKMYKGGLVKYFQEGGTEESGSSLGQLNLNSDNQIIDGPNINDISNQITSKVSGSVNNLNTNVSKANNVVEKLHSNVVNSSTLSNKLNEQSTVANTAYKNLGGSLSKVSNVDSKIQTNINDARSTSTSLTSKVSSANSVSESLASKIGIAKSLIKQLDSKSQGSSQRAPSPQAQASQNFGLSSQGFVNSSFSQPGSEAQLSQGIAASAGFTGNYGSSSFGGVVSGAADSVATATGIDFSTFAFAKGGMVPESISYYSKGTDTIPAMLSPKEYVINAANTSKFLPQLESMNKGIDPYTFPEYHAEGGMIASFIPQVFTPSTQYYNTGGSVQSHTTNVGDIHLNVTHTSRDPNFGKTIAEQLRREIRKGSIDETFFKKG